jgi:hypothetical protein
MKIWTKKFAAARVNVLRLSVLNSVGSYQMAISKVGNRRMVPKNHTRWQYSNRNYVSFHHEGHPLHLQARLRFQPNIQKKENIV